jgi:hypothetical protein
MKFALVVLGVGHVALGVWQALSPTSFFDSFAGYGLRNVHYIRDVATLYLALGLSFLGAARRRSWRVPILFFAVLQYAFHLLNHLIDVADADPALVGPVNAIAIAAAGSVLVFLLRAARRSDR